MKKKIKKKIFYIYLQKKQDFEKRFMKASFKRDQNAIQKMYERKINLMKSLQKKEEV